MHKTRGYSIITKVNRNRRIVKSVVYIDISLIVIFTNDD